MQDEGSRKGIDRAVCLLELVLRASKKLAKHWVKPLLVKVSLESTIQSQ